MLKPLLGPCDSDQHRNISQLLWCDLQTDEERIEFLESGRACVTGIIASSLVEDVAHAFRCKIAIRRAIDWANGREEEWGSRARNAFNFLYEALDGVKPYDD